MAPGENGSISGQYSSSSSLPLFFSSEGFKGFLTRGSHDSDDQERTEEKRSLISTACETNKHFTDIYSRTQSSLGLGHSLTVDYITVIHLKVQFIVELLLHVCVCVYGSVGLDLDQTRCDN